ncbi:unnamed protein product, partial [Discosporangium mesarthrocarpum]
MFCGRERESKLQSTSGFVQFMILKEDAEKDDNSEEVVGGEYTNYVSYTTWMHKLDFQAWRESQAFRSSHGSGPVTGMSKMGELLVGRPSPQLFEAVLVEPTPSEHEGGPWDFEEEPSYFDVKWVGAAMHQCQMNVVHQYFRMAAEVSM